MAKITKCPNCGSDMFTITESSAYKAAIDKQGHLTSYKNTYNAIDFIECAKCLENFIENDFEQVNIE